MTPTITIIATIQPAALDPLSFGPGLFTMVAILSSVLLLNTELSVEPKEGEGLIKQPAPQARGHAPSPA